MEFSFYTAPKIVFKNGAINELSNSIKDLGTNFLLVIDPVFKDSNHLKRILEQISKINGKVTVFSDVYNEPTVELVDEIHEIATLNGCNAVIALGGGSSIDAAKAVAATITNGNPVIDYLEYVGQGKKVTNQPVPFIAIPTTAGTGSEVTKNSVLGSKSKGFKRSMRDDKMLANVAIIDPELMVSCPPKVTAHSGIDAMTHLIEAYITHRATPLSDALAIKGIELAGKYLQRAYEDGNDMEAREGMAVASLLGGMAFANSGLGAAHGVAMAIGIKYNIPHGQACGIILPHVVKLNADVAQSKLDRIGEVLTNKRYDKAGEGTAVAIDFLYKLNDALSIEKDYKYVNIPKDDIPSLAKASIGTSMKSNPKEMTEESLREFIESLV